MILFKILLAGLALYAGIVLLAWRFQNRLAMPGAKDRLGHPTVASLRDGQPVSFTASDGVQITGWYFPPRQGGHEHSPGLLWFHGNQETVRGLEPVIAAIRPPNHGLLVVDVRGYGESGGTPSEAGLYRDAEAAWDFLVDRPEVDEHRIGVYGRSLGSAAALYLADVHPVCAVVLDSPFTNARDMASVHYRFLPSALVRLSFDNLDRASRLDRPLLVFHGAQDWIAPIRMGRAIAKVGNATRFVVFEDAGHNDTYAVDLNRYRSVMEAFLGEACP